MEYNDTVKQNIRELCRRYHIKRTKIINGVGVLVLFQHFENKFSVPYELCLQRLIEKEKSIK